MANSMTIIGRVVDPPATSHTGLQKNLPVFSVLDVDHQIKKRCRSKVYTKSIMNNLKEGMLVGITGHIRRDFGGEYIMVDQITFEGKNNEEI